MEFSEFLTSIMMMLMGIFEQAKDGLSSEEAKNLLDGIVGFAASLDPKIQLLLAAVIGAAPAWTAIKYSSKVGVRSAVIVSEIGLSPIILAIRAILLWLYEGLKLADSKLNGQVADSEKEKNKKIRRLEKELSKRMNRFDAT